MEGVLYTTDEYGIRHLTELGWIAWWSLNVALVLTCVLFLTAPSAG